MSGAARTADRQAGGRTVVLAPLGTGIAAGLADPGDSVSVVQTILSASQDNAVHCDGASPASLRAIQTERSRTSAQNFGDLASCAINWTARSTRGCVTCITEITLSFACDTCVICRQRITPT